MANFESAQPKNDFSQPGFQIDGKGSKAKLPRNAYTETEIDAAVKALAATVGRSFEIDEKGIRRVEPNLLDARVAKRVGITPEARQAFEKAFGVKLIFLQGEHGLLLQIVMHYLPRFR